MNASPASQTLRINAATNITGVLTTTNAVLTTPDLGTPSAVDLTNATNVPAGDGTLTVEENTAGVGSPNILTSGESGSVMTNAGSTATNYHTLPTAVAGLTFTFIDDDASDLIRAVANTGDVLRVGGSVSISGGFVESQARGDAITFVAVNNSTWVATTVVGTWNLETS